MIRDGGVKCLQHTIMAARMGISLMMQWQLRVLLETILLTVYWQRIMFTIRPTLTDRAMIGCRVR